MGLFRNCTRPIDAGTIVAATDTTLSVSRRTMARYIVASSIATSIIGPMTASPSHAASPTRAIRIVAYGDSLTAGYGLKPSEAFPAQLEKTLKAQGLSVEIINAGVSGDTTSAALDRYDWAIPDGIDAVIVELGANDALRGQPPEQARRNLDTILTRLSKSGVAVLLAGIPAPTNWGEAYVKAFDPMFADLAKKHGALLYPFFLDGVALKPDLSLPDGLHPNAKGVAVIVERIGPKVAELLERVAAKRKAG